MNEPSFIPERDPSEVYGSMSPLDKANAQIQHERETEPAPEKWDPGPGPQPPSGGYKPGPETPHEVQHSQLSQAEKEHIKAFEPRRPHPPRILIMSIATDTTGGFQLSGQLKFNDLSSPTQATAILDTLEELNNRLSAALDYSPI